MITRKHKTLLSAVLALAAATMTAGPLFAADSAAERRQRDLIRVMESAEASKAEKAITCKKLAIWGHKDAVPFLAPLLEDPELSSWARIALEAIPDASAGDALRYAVGRVQGRLLVGVINSLGVRREANAVDDLTPKLRDADVEIASSAAAALGKIGGERAAQALEQFLAAAPEAVRPAVAEGCILAAEQFAAAGNADRAAKLFETVYRGNVPRQRKLEAIRGAVLASGSVPLLVEQLRSDDRAAFSMALRIARELQGPRVTDALVAELAKASPDRQALLIVAMADRGDARALPAVVQAARAGQPNVRIVAARMLERLGNVSCVPVLLEAAVADNAELAAAARTSLARLPGKDVDADLFARLQASSGRARQVLIELAEQRRIDGALPVFVQLAADPDPAVRATAVVAIGAIGEVREVPGIVGLLQKTQDAKDRDALEKALMSVCGRWAAACTPHLQPLAKSVDNANRIVALRALATCGGPEALASVRAALDDTAEPVVDEAVRTLATWPNRWPNDAAVTEPLLALAKTGRKPAHQVLGLRGFLQHVQGTRQLNADQKLARLNEVMPLVTRTEEKRTVISILGSIGTAAALERLTAYAADATVTEEASAAILSLAGKNIPGATREQRRSALQAVVEHSKADATKKKAEEMLNRIK